VAKPPEGKLVKELIPNAIAIMNVIQETITTAYLYLNKKLKYLYELDSLIPLLDVFVIGSIERKKVLNERCY